MKHLKEKVKINLVNNYLKKNSKINFKDMKTITCCENCPFNVPSGEYDGYCNHPSSNEDNCQKSIHYDYGIPENEMPKTDKTSWGRYHFETNAIPQWCPIRNLKSISIGTEIKINLDNSLFEEKYKLSEQ